MKSYPGGVRHDYKDSSLPARAEHQHRWSWFALGLLLPVVTVTLLLFSEPNESMVRNDPARFGPPHSASGGTVPESLQGPEAGQDPEALEEKAGTAASADTRRSGSEDAKLEAPKHAVLAGPTSGPQPLPLPPLAPPSARDGTDAPTPRPASAEPRDDLLDLVVARGDSLDQLFRGHSLRAADLAAMVALPEARPYLVKLRPGDEIRIVRDGDRVLSLSREISADRELLITRGESGFAADTVELEIETRTVGAHGSIRSSLFEAAMEAGLSDNTTMAMAGIFQWDIDFIQDVREGDSFTVVYEEKWRDGVKLGNGDIVAAEFVNRGKGYRAARYVDARGNVGYFTPEGRSVRRAFIRAPVDFTRISSNFNPNRRHPVLNTIRAHRGVDYAAPTGTPVKAAGDGKVKFRGVNGGYGNAIVLQHGGNITTLYGHLSRFGSFRQGSRVKQGDIIGYVGQSGLATGPHLHYEYRVDGVHRNPRTVPLPAADPVPAEYRDDFQARSATLWHQLDLYDDTRFAATGD